MAAGTPTPLATGYVRSISAALASRWSFIVACIVTACAMLFLYTWRLDQAQPYINHDEAGFGLSVHLLATTGRDYFGNLLPIYVGYLDNHQLGGAIQSYWAIPFVKVLGLSVESVRLSIALVGLVTLGMFGYLAWRLSENRWISLLGVWLLGTTPLFFMQSRVFLDTVMPVLFIAGWLICVAEVERRKSGRMLLLSALVLGVGAYSYGTARMVMPVYMGLTLLLVLISRSCSWRSVLAAGALFTAMMLPALAFAAQDPDLYFTRYRQLTWLGDDGLTAPAAVSAYLAHYFSLFDPMDLFVRGDASLIHSTGMAGSYLWATLPLVITGLGWLVWRSLSEREPMRLLLPLALLLFPVPLALISEQHAPSRGTYVTVIYTALAVVGASALARWRRSIRADNLALGIMVVIGAIQATLFFADYFGAYGARSTAQVEFDGNKRGAFEALLSGANGNQVYYDVENAATTTYARFFKATVRFPGGVDPAPPEWADRLPAGAYLLTVRPEAYGTGFQVVKTIPELAPGRPPHVILRKTGKP